MHQGKSKLMFSGYEDCENPQTTTLSCWEFTTI